MSFYDNIPEAAKWLDVKKPNWFSEIDKENLDMWSNTNCVLGQLYRSYGHALYEYSIPCQSVAFGSSANRDHWFTEINVRSGSGLTALEVAEKTILELETKLREEKDKLKALINPEISITLSKKDWQVVSDVLELSNRHGAKYLMAIINGYTEV